MFVEKLAIFGIVYLDDILIYINNNEDRHVVAVKLMLEQLKKFLLFANLKKYRFYREEIWFLGYMISSKSIHMKDERIKAVKRWPKSQSIQDIQVFLGFANFYWRFIQVFSRIAAPLSSMLKISKCTEFKTRPRKGGVKVGGSKAGHDGSKLDENELNSGEVDGDEVKSNKVEKKVQNLSKSKKTVGLDFFTPKAKLAFIKLRQAFFKAPIFHHFDPEGHIWIETDVLGYVIGRVFS